MPDQRIGLDNPVFVGRYRQFGRGSYMPNRPKNVATQIVNDIQFKKQIESSNQGTQEIEPQFVDVSEYEPVAVTRSDIKRSIGSPVVKPPVSRVSKSAVIQRHITQKPLPQKQRASLFSPRRVMIGMLVIVFLAGLGTVIVGFRSDRNVQAQTFQQ